MYFSIRYYCAFSTFSLNVCNKIESCTYHMCAPPPPHATCWQALFAWHRPPPPPVYLHDVSIVVPLWCPSSCLQLYVFEVVGPDKHILDSCICLLIQVNLGHISLRVLHRNAFTPVLTYPVNIVHEHNYFCKIQCIILWNFIKMKSLYGIAVIDLEIGMTFMKSMKAKMTCRLVKKVQYNTYVQKCWKLCTIMCSKIVRFGIFLVIFFLPRSLFDSYYFIILTDISQPLPCTVYWHAG